MMKILNALFKVVGIIISSILVIFLLPFVLSMLVAVNVAEHIEENFFAMLGGTIILILFNFLAMHYWSEFLFAQLSLLLR